MRILLATSYSPYSGNSPTLRLVNALARKLSVRGHRVGRLLMPFEPASFERTQRSMDIWRWEPTEFEGQYPDLVVTFDFPSHGLQHPRKVAWLTSRPEVYSDPAADESWRGAVVGYENQNLLSSYARYAVSSRVRSELMAMNGLEAVVLTPPPENPSAYSAGQERGYILAPDCSLEDYKRLLDAMRSPGLSSSAVVFGPPEYAELAIHVGLGAQVRILSDVSDEDRALLFSHARAVLLPGQQEAAFALVEARLASKPAIVPGTGMELSGGLIGAGDEAGALAAVLQRIDADPEWARRTGYEGRLFLEGENVSWDSVIETILS